MAATCALPAAFGYALWIVSGATGALIIGLMVGLLLTSLTFWVLFRPQGEEIVPSYAATCAGFLGGVLASAVILLVISLLLNVTMDGFHVADRLRANPVGPSFAWNVTPIAPSAHKETAVDVPATDGHPEGNAPNSHHVPGSIFEDGVETPHDHAPGAASISVVSESPKRETPSPAPSSAPLESTGPTGDPFLASIADRHLPYIVAVHAGLALGPFDDLVNPMVFSSWCAAVRRNGPEDVVETWDIHTWTPGPTANFPRTDGQGVMYALSPDGLLVARAVQFPRAAIQIWSMKESRMLRSIDPMEDYLDPPQLIGFSGPRTVVIRGRRESDEVIELHDALDADNVRAFWVYRHIHSTNNCKLSPDGKLLAVAARVGTAAQVLIYELDQLKKPQALAARSLDARWEVEPADIAFSQDGSTITALFEHEGAAVFMSWKNGNPLPDRICPGAWPRLTQTARSGAHLLDFIGSDNWLLSGNAMVDLDSGRLVSRLSSSVESQWLSDGQTLHLVYRDAANMRRVATLQIDPALMNRQLPH